MKITNIEPTPNPNALKFNVDGILSKTGVRQFDNSDKGKADPLAGALFGHPGVESVFYSSQFVTVSKTSDAQWGELQSKIIGTLESFDPTALSGKPAQTNGTSETPTATDDALLEKINQVIDSNVRPPLENDGGGLQVISLEGYVLTIHYQGACGSCPSATQGTMMAIQNLLRAMVDPRIQVVSA